MASGMVGLVLAVAARVDRYRREGAAEAVLSPEAASEAGELERAVDESGNVPGFAALAWFHLCRYMAARGASVEDLASALDFCERLDGEARRLRPPRLALAIDCVDDILAGRGHVRLDIDDENERAACAALLFAMSGVWWQRFVDSAKGLSPDPSREGSGEGRTTAFDQADRAVAGMQAALEILSEDHPGWLPARATLGAYLSQRGRIGGRDADIETGASILRSALGATTPGHPERRSIFQFLLGALMARHERNGPAAVMELADTLRSRLDELDPDDPEAHDLRDLGRATVTIAGPLPGGHDPDQAVALARLAVAVHRPGDPGHLVALQQLAIMLAWRGGQVRSESDMDEGISVQRSQLALAEEAGDGRFAVLARTTLSAGLAQRFEQTGDVASLDEALASAAEALRDLDVEPPQEAALLALCLTNLGAARLMVEQMRGDRSALDGAIDNLRAAIDASAPGEVRDRASYLLCGALLRRFERDGERVDIDEAVSWGRAGRRSRSVASSGMLLWTGNLGNALMMRFEHAGDPADLEAAVVAYRQDEANIPGHHLERAQVCSRLGAGLLYRHQRNGSEPDLDDAMAFTREALRQAPPASPVSQHSRCILGIALTHLYERTGRQAYLDEAIELMREAAGETSPLASRTAYALVSLGAAQQVRYDLTGSTEDLNGAVSAFEAALDVTAAASRTTPQAQVNLGNSLAARVRLTGDHAEIERAIAMLDAARNAPSLSALDRPRCHHNLSGALMTRFELTHDATDLDGAVEAMQAAVDALPSGHSSTARYQAGLGLILTTRARHRGDAAELDAAIETLARAVDGTRPYDPRLAGHIVNLMGALETRYRRSGSTADLAEMQRLAERATEATGSPAALRVLAAQTWGALAVEAGQHEVALTAYQLAVELLPLVGWHGIRRSDQERQLTELTGLASDAAAVAIAAGQPTLAVELLEQGRTVLWSRLLETRQDIAAIRAASPDLADRLETVRVALNEHVDYDLAGIGAPASDRSMLAHQWDQLVSQARALPGLEDFLRPRPFEQLAAAGAEGPVVMVNVSRFGCDAIVVSNDDATVVPLSELDMAEAVRRTEALLEALDRPSREGRSVAAVVGMHITVAATLDWLWDAVAGPVLDTIAGAERLWWCPTGPLALLPLHAAGRAGAGPEARQSVLDRVVSSYTPTLRALLEARASVERPTPKLLIVAMPETTGAPDLAVQPEVDVLTTLLPGQHTLVEGPDADRHDVVHHLTTHSWVHFACHGFHDLWQPSRSGVVLHDGPLTVLEMVRMQLPHAELAFLSACRTAIGGIALPDEAIHLAAALQASGFRHVVAALWSVYDAHAPGLTTDIYSSLLDANTGTVSSEGAARAVHAAVQRLRTSEEGSLPAAWAPYVHIGP